MTALSHRIPVFAFAFAAFILIADQASAQTDVPAGGIGEAAVISTGEVSADTSAFTIDRGDTVGGAPAETGFGVGAETGVAGGGAGGRGLGGGGGLGGLLGGLFGGLNQGTTTSKPAIRVRLRSAIEVPPTPPAQVQAAASRRLSSVTKAPALRGVNVTMSGRTAVLSGVVRSQKDRRMSELLMRLEPGVKTVDNRISVITP